MKIKYTCNEYDCHFTWIGNKRCPICNRNKDSTPHIYIHNGNNAIQKRLTLQLEKNIKTIAKLEIENEIAN